MNQLSISLPLFRQLVRDASTQASQALHCPVGFCRRGDGVELLATPPNQNTDRWLLFSCAETLNAQDYVLSGVAGILLVGQGSVRGQARGLVRVNPELNSGPFEPLHRLNIVGAGMHSLNLLSSGAAEPFREVLVGPDGAVPERWSRTIGALGADVWQRLTQRRMAIIGVGRTGSGLAVSLVRQGVRRLVLIDADRVEEGNLGEMNVPVDDFIGDFKVEAVASLLREMASSSPQGKPDIVPIADSITRLRALRAALECDLWLVAVDHDGARLAATGAASLFCKPLMDIGSGIHGTGEHRQMGADVRLLLPGRCLLCAGGLRDGAQARRTLASASAEAAFHASRDWRRERAGSLASLNQCAMSIGLRLLEDLMDERVSESVWAHLEFDARGSLSVWYPDFPADGACPLCALSGQGEMGLPRLVESFRAINEPRSEHES